MRRLAMAALLLTTTVLAEDLPPEALQLLKDVNGEPIIEQPKDRDHKTLWPEYEGALMCEDIICNADGTFTLVNPWTVLPPLYDDMQIPDIPPDESRDDPAYNAGTKEVTTEGKTVIYLTQAPIHRLPEVNIGIEPDVVKYSFKYPKFDVRPGEKFICAAPIMVYRKGLKRHPATPIMHLVNDKGEENHLTEAVWIRTVEDDVIATSPFKFWWVNPKPPEEDEDEERHPQPPSVDAGEKVDPIPRVEA